MRKMRCAFRQSCSGCTWKKKQPEAADPGRGVVGTDVTCIIEGIGVESGSFAAADGRFLEISRDRSKFYHSCGGARRIGETCRFTRKKEVETLEFETLPNCAFVWIW